MLVSVFLALSATDGFNKEGGRAGRRESERKSRTRTHLGNVLFFNEARQTLAGKGTLAFSAKQNFYFNMHHLNSRLSKLLLAFVNETIFFVKSYSA